MAIAVPVTLFDLIGPCFARENLLGPFQIGSQIIRMSDFLKRKGEQFSVGVSEDLAQRTVDTEKSTVRRDRSM